MYVLYQAYTNRLTREVHPGEAYNLPPPPIVLGPHQTITDTHTFITTQLSRLDGPPRLAALKKLLHILIHF